MAGKALLAPAATPRVTAASTAAGKAADKGAALRTVGRDRRQRRGLRGGVQVDRSLDPQNQPSKLIEDAVVKTVAGFLNTDGGRC